MNHAQELGLRFRADRRNFVEENRALVGHFEKALLRGDGAGERALHVAEKLRFEQIDGNRAGIDGNERFVGARGSGVNRLGDQFLTGAALAVDQHGGARRRHLRNQVEHGEHLFALADDVGEIVALLQRALQLDVLFAQPAALDGDAIPARSVRRSTTAW